MNPKVKWSLLAVGVIASLLTIIMYVGNLGPFEKEVTIVTEEPTDSKEPTTAPKDAKAELEQWVTDLKEEYAVEEKQKSEVDYDYHNIDLIRTYMEQGNLVAAKEQTEAWYQEYPNSMYLLFTLSDLELQMTGKPDTSIALLEEFLDRHPRMPDVHFKLADLYLAHEDVSKAQAEARTGTGIALADNYPDPEYFLDKYAWILYWTEEKEKAKELYEHEIMKSDIQDLIARAALAVYHYANILEIEGKASEAVPLYQAMVDFKETEVSSPNWEDFVFARQQSQEALTHLQPSS
ncbi:tetratricopeptide repeat protein [Cytobacillus sp. FJAT-54145]|uniref:Tetratricopeptide repeat protein n=1 Tax=Cytobacillus spartinae TaxID=3299023 RepID=A0ABW6KA02_9BACI